MTIHFEYLIIKMIVFSDRPASWYTKDLYRRLFEDDKAMAGVDHFIGELYTDFSENEEEQLDSETENNDASRRKYSFDRASGRQSEDRAGPSGLIGDCFSNRFVDTCFADMPTAQSSRSFAAASQSASTSSSIPAANSQSTSATTDNPSATGASSTATSLATRRERDRTLLHHRFAKRFPSLNTPVAPPHRPRRRPVQNEEPENNPKGRRVGMMIVVMYHFQYVGNVAPSVDTR